jgi:hypothetical protein
VNGVAHVPVVAAIVVNWNGSRDTVRAIGSLAQSRYPALRILIVDSGSGPVDLADDERLTVQPAGVALRTSFPAPRGLGKGTPMTLPGRGRSGSISCKVRVCSCAARRLLRSTAWIRIFSFMPKARI